MYGSSTKSKGFKGKIKNKKYKIQESSKKTNVCENIRDIFPNFSNYGNLNSKNEKKNYFCILPDEIILRIFARLSHCVLKTCCAMVCKHWNKLSDDFSLWKKFDYEGKVIRATHIRKLVALGVEQLDLSKAKWENYIPLFPISFKMRYSDKRFSRLQYLYLHLSKFRFHGHDKIMDISKFTADILSICACLKVLKLFGIYLNYIICYHISMNEDLRGLYWISCTRRRFLNMSILEIFQRCKKLETLDFSDTNLEDEEMWSITNNLPSCLSSLMLFEINNITEFEKHMEIIVNRCPNITYFGIACKNYPYLNTFNLIVNSLPKLTTFDISRLDYDDDCDDDDDGEPFPVKDLIDVKEMCKLIELIIPWTCSNSDISLLKNTLKGVRISISEDYLDFC